MIGSFRLLLRTLRSKKSVDSGDHFGAGSAGIRCVLGRDAIIKAIAQVEREIKLDQESGFA